LKGVKEHREKEVLNYFQYCPLCLARDSIRFEWGSRIDYTACTECGAKWHLDYGLTGFHWARLVKGDTSGRASKELLEEKHEPYFWMLMALEGLKLKTLVTPPKCPIEVRRLLSRFVVFFVRNSTMNQVIFVPIVGDIDSLCSHKNIGSGVRGVSAFSFGFSIWSPNVHWLFVRVKSVLGESVDEVLKLWTSTPQRKN
jgi:hypothetical protein